MKAMEILAESKKLDEAPASMLGQVARRAGAGVLGAMGLNTLAGSINDKADVGMFANRYYKEFSNYLKSQNIDADRATFSDLKSFMSKNKIPTQNVPNNPSGVASKEMVNSILSQTAQEYLAGKTPKNSNSTDATSKSNTSSVKNSGGNTSASNTSTTPAPATSTADVDSLIQQISKLNAADLAKLEKAIETTKAASPQDFAARRAAAAKAAQAQMTAKPSQPTPSDVRTSKQAVAAQSAQAQMTAKPVTTPVPASNKRRRGRNKGKRVVPAV